MCKICKKNTEKIQVGSIHYNYCPNCMFLMKDSKHYLDSEKEKKRYSFHHNDSNDGYILYQKKFIHMINEYLTGKTLDFGCGDNHILATLIGADYYDKYFYPNENYLHEIYDTIIMEEVIEHLVNPLDELAKLVNVLTNKGKLIIRTQLLKSDADLEKWWYLRDETHVCFYSYQTFERICELFSLKIIYCNDLDLIILQKV